MPNGHQDHWLAGSRFYFKRDAINSVEQPILDIGIVDPINPDFQPDEIELKDTDGGVNTLIESTIREIEETYEITTRNLNMQNLAFAFLSNPPAEFSQSAAHKSVQHAVITGHLVKLHDSDSDATELYNVQISGITSAAVSAGVLSTDAITDIDASTGAITTSADLTAHISADDYVIIQGTGLANIKNAVTAKVVSVSATEVIVGSGVFTANETGITGSMIYKNSTDTGTVYKVDVDWAVKSHQRGIARCIEGGAITTGNVTIHFSTIALSGPRLLLPQAGISEIKGQGYFFWSRKNFSEETVREARVSISSNAANVQNEDYSELTLTIKVLSDVNQTNSAGRLIHFLGDNPSLS